MRKVKRIYAKIGKYERVSAKVFAIGLKGFIAFMVLLGLFCASTHKYDITLTRQEASSSKCAPTNRTKTSIRISGDIPNFLLLPILVLVSVPNHTKTSIRISYLYLQSSTLKWFAIDLKGFYALSLILPLFGIALKGF